MYPFKPIIDQYLHTGHIYSCLYFIYITNSYLCAALNTSSTAYAC